MNEIEANLYDFKFYYQTESIKIYNYKVSTPIEIKALINNQPIIC